MPYCCCVAAIESRISFSVVDVDREVLVTAMTVLMLSYVPMSIAGVVHF